MIAYRTIRIERGSFAGRMRESIPPMLFKKKVIRIKLDANKQLRKKNPELKVIQFSSLGSYNFGFPEQ